MDVERLKIPADVTQVQDIPSDLLSPSLISRLPFPSLFPVQAAVLPLLLKTRYSSAKSSPSDVCVSAPTGSGKTLAYALPIVESLQSRVIPRLRALIVLPTSDLALQVKETFESLLGSSFKSSQSIISQSQEGLQGSSSQLKVVLLTGQSSMATEHKALFSDAHGKFMKDSNEPVADIVIATPGRLLDHLTSTKFTPLKLSHLWFLVIDEADRLLSQSYQDWLPKVLERTNSKSRSTGSIPINDLGLPFLPMTPITRRYNEFESNINDNLLDSYTPLRKLVFSATLASDPTLLAPLKLYKPQYITVVTEKEKDEVPRAKKPLQKFMDGQDTGSRFTLPPTLEEFQFVTTSDEKPLALFYLLLHLDLQGVLVFTRSVESAHRLSFLFRKFTTFLKGPSHSLTCDAISSDLSKDSRSKLLASFKASHTRILFCSDVMARGIDLGPSVQTVINFDVPNKLLTYVHRVGRSARAGRSGQAFTLLEDHQVKWFKMVVAQSGQIQRSHEKIHNIKANRGEMEILREAYVQALSELKESVQQSVGKKHALSEVMESDTKSSSTENDYDSSESDTDTDTKMELDNDYEDVERIDHSPCQLATASDGWWGKDWT